MSARVQGGMPTSFKVFVVCGALALGFSLGVGVGRWPALWKDTAAVDTVPKLPSGVDFSLFWEVWELAKEEYVEQPVSDEDLFYGALSGLLSGLDDPYSNFFDPKLAEEFQRDLEGTFFGIGAEIGLDEDGSLLVVAPLPDTPADRAGVLAGDYILRIDDAETVGMSVQEAVTKIRGDKGTKVTLEIYRAGAEATQKLEIVRDEIKVESVRYEVKDGIGVITVAMFNDDTTRLFETALKKLRDQNVKGYLIDLRNNPGGLLDASIEMAGLFTGDRPVVLEEIQGERRSFAPDGAKGEYGNVPVIVLVNQGSASASEILAGALQDYGLAKIAGETTFGKGSVQQYHELKDGSAVKITVARWLTPNGRTIQGQGITPDVVLPFTPPTSHDSTDSQLDAALDLFAAP